jgi:hypothetical protein
MSYKLGTDKSPIDNRDYILEAIKPIENETIPLIVDYRKELPPVRDQGSQGTCSAQTASCIKEWHERKDIDFKDYMSPQFIYNNRSNSGEGMYPRDTMQILQKLGSVPEESYPYGTIETSADIAEDLIDEASNFQISSYASVNTVEGLKKALATNGPCYISFPVYHYGEWFWKPVDGSRRLLGGHAVAVVGYDKKGFFIRNSWGESWGDEGHTYYPFEQWGSHWEVWTAIDENSERVLKPKTWWNSILNYLNYWYEVIFK